MGDIQTLVKSDIDEVISFWDQDDLEWFWKTLANEQVAGKSSMGDSKIITVKVPGDPLMEDEYRSCSLAGRSIFSTPLKAGTFLELDRSELDTLFKPFTCAEVALAIYQRRTLAKRRGRQLQVAAKERRWALRQEAGERVKAVLGLDETQWRGLCARGWHERAGDIMAEGFLKQVRQLIEALPMEGNLVDRRKFGQDVVGNPHALDAVRPMGMFCLAVLEVTGKVGRHRRARDSWREVGILSDGIHDGMAVLGVSPKGGALPEGFVVTVVPRMLEEMQWESPIVGESPTVFVTENPSVLEAAVGIAGAKVMCTMGSPSLEMFIALRAAQAAGWEILVRGDFDWAGLCMVNDVLREVPGSVPWRMDKESYLSSIGRGGEGTELYLDGELEGFWDQELVEVMLERKRAGFEEGLLEELTKDIKAGGV